VHDPVIWLSSVTRRWIEVVISFLSCRRVCSRLNVHVARRVLPPSPRSCRSNRHLRPQPLVAVASLVIESRAKIALTLRLVGRAHPRMTERLARESSPQLSMYGARTIGGAGESRSTRITPLLVVLRAPFDRAVASQTCPR